MKVVLDTNVLASGTITADTAPGQILDYWRMDRFNLVVSEHIIDELKQTFNKPYFQKHVSKARITKIIDLLQNETIVVPLRVKVRGVATSPEDDLILATALSAKADYLVTGAGPLLRKVGNSYQGVNLVTPNDFLQVLQKEE